MKKRILALLATAIMVVSSTVMTFADTTTGLIGHYKFDDNLKNEVTGVAAVVTGKTIDTEVTASAESYANGVDGKAVLLQGINTQYGLELTDAVPSTNTFTVSYDIWYLECTAFSPTLFYGTKWKQAAATDDRWISFGYGFNASLASAAGAWAYFAVDGTAGYRDYYDAAGYASQLGLDESNAMTKWANITYTVDAGKVTSYVNGEAVALPEIILAEDVCGPDARMFLGINAWDAPLNGAVDNLMIYDRALTAEDVAELVSARDYDAATKPEFKERETTSNRPTTAGNDAPWLETFTVAPTTSSNNGGGSGVVIGIAVAVVVVIVVVVVVAVVAGKKKAAADDDDEE